MVFVGTCLCDWWCEPDRQEALGWACAANYSRIAINCWFDVDRPNALMSRSSAVKAARSGRLDSVRNQRARTPYAPAMFCDVASQINGAARFVWDTGRKQ